MRRPHSGLGPEAESHGSADAISRLRPDGGREPASSPETESDEAEDPATSDGDDAVAGDSSDSTADPSARTHVEPDEPNREAAESAPDPLAADERPSGGDRRGGSSDADTYWRRLRPLLALPAGLLEGVVTVVVTWLFIGMVFLFEVGGDIETFEASVGAPDSTALGRALEAFSAEELVLGVAKLITWVVAGAHQVAVEVDAPNAADTVNVLTSLGETGGWVTPIVYMAIPPLLLLYGGYQLSRAKTGATVLRSVGTGALIAIGYGFGMGILALLSGIDASGGLSVGANPITFAVVGGLYGVVFGGLGGVIAAALHRS